MEYLILCALNDKVIQVIQQGEILVFCDFDQFNVLISHYAMFFYLKTVPYFLAKITDDKVGLDHIWNWDKFFEKGTDSVSDVSSTIYIPDQSR